VHAQLAGGATLVAFVFLEHREYEFLFEFPYSLGIENIASIHLQDQSFELIFHGVSLSIRRLAGSSRASGPWARSWFLQSYAEHSAPDRNERAIPKAPTK